jgi:hypothetical protein
MDKTLERAASIPADPKLRPGDAHDFRKPDVELKSAETPAPDEKPPHGPDPVLAARPEPNDDAMMEKARPRGSPLAEKTADQKSRGGPVADKGQP